MITNSLERLGVVKGGVSRYLHRFPTLKKKKPYMSLAEFRRKFWPEDGRFGQKTRIDIHCK